MMCPTIDQTVVSKTRSLADQTDFDNYFLHISKRAHFLLFWNMRFYKEKLSGRRDWKWPNLGFSEIFQYKTNHLCLSF